MFTVRNVFRTTASEGRYEVFEVLTGTVVLVTRSAVTAVAAVARCNSTVRD